MAKGDGGKIFKQMPEHLEELLQSTAVYGDEAKKLCAEKCPSDKGIYVFYEGEKALYVGRSDRIKGRINEHGNGKISERSSSAAFAVILAKEKLFKKKYPEHSDKTMKEIWNLKEFKGLTYGKIKGQKDFERFFKKAQERIREMHVGVVGIADHNEQSIFEVYAHLELEAPYNSFRNH